MLYTDSKKLAYFGTKFVTISNISACYQQAVVMHGIQAIQWILGIMNNIFQNI